MTSSLLRRSATTGALALALSGGTLLLPMDADLVNETIDAILSRAEADPAFPATVDAAVRTALTAKADAELLPEA